MNEALQSAIDFGKSIATKVYPILDWVAVKISTFIDVASENVHLLLLGGISMYVASIITGRELGIKFWIITGTLWWGLKYLGF